MSFSKVISLILGTAVLVAGVSCTREAIPSASQSGEKVSLSFCLSQNQAAATKMSDAVTQIAGTEASFRGLQEVHIIPFQQETVSAGTSTDDYELSLPYSGIAASFAANVNPGLVENNHSHLYKGVFVPGGTRSFLVYARAADTGEDDGSVAFRKRNGAIEATGLGQVPLSTSDLSFSPVPFTQNSTFTEPDAFASLLNTVLSGGVIASADKAGDNALIGLLEDFTNFGLIDRHGEADNNYGYRLVAASGPAVASVLTALYKGIRSLDPATDASTAVKNRILQNFTSLSNTSRLRLGETVTITDASLAGFPADTYGVPEGTFALRFNGGVFVREGVETSGLRLADAGRFCYPPALWYRANSNLKTTENSGIEEEYVSSNTDWTDILNAYTQGTVVRPGIASVAIVDPLQYAVGSLSIKLKPFTGTSGHSGEIADADGQYYDVSSGESFPLTGIIIGEQRVQDYAFTPLASGSPYYSFDSYTASGSPSIHISTATNNASVTTLVFQTKGSTGSDAVDVPIVAEFQNNSGRSFTGANGLVPVGGKFYLIGLISGEDATAALPSVFIQDHITTVTLTVKDLASAFSVVPDLENLQLEVGVSISLDWIQSTPVIVPLT